MEILIVLLLVLLLASLWDYKKGRIPNLILAIGAIHGLLRVFYYQNFLSHIPGILFPILILYPLYKIGTIGAGDIKLFSVMGFYLSFMETIYCMFLAFVIGAVVSLIVQKNNGNLADRISYLLSYLKDAFLNGKFRYYYQDEAGNILSSEERKKSQIHLAFPIFISVLLHLGGGIL